MIQQSFWVGFHVIIIAMLLWDLRPRKKARSFKEDAVWSLFTIVVGLSLGFCIFYLYGLSEGIKYVTAYVTELALSVDNLFVFMVIFTYFAVPPNLQHKTLFYGILGAIVFRATFLFVGIELIERFHPIIYVFGAILILSAYKLFKGGVEETNPEDNPILKVAQRIIPMHESYDGDKFLTKLDGAYLFTPLICVLLVIETTDIMFALDSVPAVLTITGEFFTAYTSNIMAILGLRALYFVVNHAMGELKYMSKGLALVLAYLGFKTFATYFNIEIPTLWNMGIVLGTILMCVILSLLDQDKTLEGVETIKPRFNYFIFLSRCL